MKNKWKGFLFAVACVPLAAPSAQAQDRWTSARPDGHAPIGVMGDHMHSKGEMMLSYRFMSMEMDGNRNGTDALTAADVLGMGYRVTPTSMPMKMHMGGVMYAPSDWLTLMAMVPFVSIEMDHRMGNGNTFTTDARDIGDSKLNALITVLNASRQAVMLNAGVSFPTGSIGEMDVTPMSNPNQVQLPYPMQTGSGTYDLLPGITYLGQGDDLSWGAQAKGVIRLGENARDYSLGDQVLTTGWLAGRLNESFSLSGRVEWSAWGDIEGADAALNPMMVPTADPARRQGNRIDGLVGLNYEVTSGSLDGNRLAIEFGYPLYQSLDGPQLETDWLIVAGWQYAFQLFGTHND